MIQLKARFTPFFWRSTPALLFSTMMLFNAPLHAAKELTVAGTGDATTVLRLLAKEFNRGNSGVTVLVPDSVGSGGGVKAVTANKVGLGRTARPLKAKEKKRGPNLREHLFAYSPVVFVTHAALESPVSMQSSDLIKVFAGEIKDWNLLRSGDQKSASLEKIYPVMREDGDSSRKVLGKSMPGFKELNSPAKIFFTTPEAVAAIKQHKQTIGYVPLSWALQEGLKVMQIDGKTPRSAGADWPHLTPLYLISNGAPSTEAQAFLDFVRSTKGRMLIEQHGMIASQ